jgi:hypothetical protein
MGGLNTPSLGLPSRSSNGKQPWQPRMLASPTALVVGSLSADRYDLAIGPSSRARESESTRDQEQDLDLARDHPRPGRR